METAVNTSEVMYISLNQAAKKWGKSKGTISKMASSGRLQWHPQSNGEKKLLLSELAHHFGPPPSEQDEPVSKLTLVTNNEQSETAGNVNENRVLQAELTAAHEMIEIIKSQLERERELMADQLSRERANADAWRQAAESATEMLKALPPPPRETFSGTTIEHQETPRRLSFIERLTGWVKQA